jgi:hypothetical protein
VFPNLVVHGPNRQKSSTRIAEQLYAWIAGATLEDKGNEVLWSVVVEPCSLHIG